MSRISSSLVGRKLNRLAAVPRRFAVNTVETRESGRPPVIANSVPKSGTHLLLQVLASLPGMRRWGLFIAAQPSFRFRRLPPATLARKVRNMANRELAGAHLDWSAEVASALRKRDVVHFLISRDPRDVVVSEAHYLAEMNRWHKLHSRFNALPDLQSRIRLSITGLDASSALEYPDISSRYGRFLRWFEEPDVCAIRYEDLAGSEAKASVMRIVEHWLAHDEGQHSLDELLPAALESIRPERSHTFRSGGSGKWREIMDDETKACFARHAERLAVKLGYPETDS